MIFKASSIPSDSIVHLWMDSLAITEVPLSYQVFTCLSVIGSLLKRQVWLDQVEWKVYSNLSVLLVGPSGIGKDVIIRRAQDCVNYFNEDLDVGGKTMEAICQQLLDLGCPACAFIVAPELTAFLGGKDYQKSMVQELTDLLSTGEKVNISLKGSPEKRIIRQPTLTMLAGSTEAWLHKAMPEGSLEGGLLPRFILIYEDYGSKHIPLLKYSTEKADREKAHRSKTQLLLKIAEILHRFKKPKEITPLADAVDLYTSWYHTRYKKFSPAVRPYANRSRDQVLRMALLMAITRGHDYIESTDIEFACDMMNYVAMSLDKVTCPPSVEAQIGEALLNLMPCTYSDLLKIVGRKWKRRDINESLDVLRVSGRAKELSSKITLSGHSEWVAIKGE